MGGWTELKTEKPETDTDIDGMPDNWELQNKLNPNLPDNNKNTLDSNYTNIEMYVNSLVEKLMVQ